MPAAPSLVSSRASTSRRYTPAAPLYTEPDAELVTAISQAALLQMPFPAFARTVADLLGHMGYEQVILVKAMHGKGRNVHGGYDLQMRLPTHLTHGVVIAQVKQYREPVPRAFVDELRGTMLRVGASQGLLISAGPFSASAVEAAQAAQHAAPVRLFGGDELVRMLRSHPASASFGAGSAPSPTVPSPSLAARVARRTQEQKAGRLECAFPDDLSAFPAQQGKPPVPPSAAPQTKPQEDKCPPVLLFSVDVALLVPAGMRTTSGFASDSTRHGRSRP